MIDEFKKKANITGERLAEGREEALEELISLYQNKIYSISYRFTSDKDEAFDLSQEIFLRAYSKISLYKRETDFNAWFLRLAVNTAINYKTKASRNPSRKAEVIDDSLKLSAHRLSSKMADKERSVARLNSLMKKLPKRERLVIVLQLIEERKVKDIARIMGTSVKSVESLLTRARRRLRSLMEKNEGF